MKSITYIIFLSLILLSCQTEEERIKEENYKKYENNSLANGSMPYYKYYGAQISCLEDLECSTISVKTPENSDVIVTTLR